VNSRKNIYPDLIPKLERRQPLALATIIQASGSTPQVAGASAVFSQKGLVLGTLGGGIIEAEAQKKASSALQKKKSLFYEFRLQGDGLSEEEAVCGGSVAVLIDASPFQSLQAFILLKESLRLRRAGLLAILADVNPTGEAAIRRRWLDALPSPEDVAELKPFLDASEIGEVLCEGNPRLAKRAKNMGKVKDQSFLFLEPLYPLARLLIAGAGHVGRALAHLGKFLDFEVTVIDDRPEFASLERIPEADALIVGDIGQAVRGFPISSDAYIVIVTRGHRHDAEALKACLRSSAAYIGMIGSARKVALMREKFLEQGWATVAEFDRVHAPVGLRIGSKTVEEIALSIAAELVLTRSQAHGEEGK
jgi:xanthine dehydrogenase accessory factor